MANNYYEESQRAKKAREEWEKKKSEKPGAYVSQWKPLVDAALEKLQNRRDFSYDAAGDALYRQYKDSYLRNGRQAMEDASARAAVKTGGYGSSYGETAAAQTYGGYMAELAEKIPELYRLALERYNTGTERLREDYETAAQREKAESDAYRQMVSDWEKEVERLEKTYTDARDFDYSLAKEASDTEKWQQELEEKKRQFEIRYGEKSASSGGGGGTNRGSEQKTENEFDTLNLWLRDQKVAGTSRETLIGKINDAYIKGKISRGEMLTLMGWYGTAGAGTGGANRETAGSARLNQNYLR